MSVADEIQKLKNLHAVGAISDEEFQTAKNQVFADETRANERRENSSRPRDASAPPRSDPLWPVLVHVSFFAAAIGPFIIWLLRRDADPAVDAHGKAVCNWLLTSLLGFIAGGILCATVILLPIGLPFLWALGVVSVIFPIIGAVKAASGVVWRYPGTIRFID
jgi:uncharacterized protein